MPFQSNSPFKVESPSAMRGRNTQQNFMKGIAKAIEDYSNIEAERTKIKGQVMINELKAKQNFFYKIQEQMAERENKLRFIKEAQAQFGQDGGMSGEGGVATDINAPRMELGAGAEPTLKYPSARDKEFNIKLGLNRIALKEKKGMPLTSQEQTFKENYGGMATGEKEVTQNQIVNLAIKLAQSESGGFASQEDIRKQIPVAQQMLMGTDFSAPKEEVTNQYTPDQEQLIQDNMTAYKKPRDIVIEALTNRGLLK